MRSQVRTRNWRLASAAVALLVATGCGLVGGDDEPAAAPSATVGVTPSEDLSAEDLSAEDLSAEASEEPAAEPSPTPSRKPSRKPTAEPVKEPFWASELPPCAFYDKTKPIAKAKVKAALKSASARIYWQTKAPDLRLNYPLVKAIAWQESGWQSNIHNCDGGMGVMQVMPGTVEFVNGRFGLAYDPKNYQDNAYAGANYLAWFTKWAEENYFKGSYDLSPKKCQSPTSWCLLNVVISGYNAGQGGIEAAAATRTLPNPDYVAAVRAHMARCQCDQY